MKIKEYIVHHKWQIFCARDFNSLMHPLFFISLLFGIFPYKVNSTNYVISKPRFIYCTVCAVFHSSYVFISLYNLNRSSSYSSIPGTLQGNFFEILCGIICLITYILSRPRLRVIQDLSDVSSRLPRQTFNDLAKWIHAKNLLGCSFLFCHIFWIWKYSLSDGFNKLASLYLIILVFLMDMFYMDCVCVLKACFVRINENLINLKDILKTDEPHLLRRVYHEQRNPLLLIELQAIKEKHLQISTVLQTFNNTFSFQVIATVVLTFIEVTFSLYFYILQINGSDSINLDHQIWYSYFSTSIAYYFTKLVLIVWACQTGKDEAFKVGSNIHRVLISTFDKQIKNELELFSLQVLHRDNVFSAKGLIVDATLLTKIVSGVTTYLLILLQFLLTGLACFYNNEAKKEEEGSQWEMEEEKN